MLLQQPMLSRSHSRSPQDLTNYKYDNLVQLSQRLLFKLLSTKATVFKRCKKSLVRCVAFACKRIHV